MAVGQIQAEAELRRALHNGQVVPYFQPFVQVRSGTVCGFEVLARWVHPIRGLVNPDEFIPLAERFGIIDADDLGTGHSSLRNPQALPFDEIKVDRSFVGSMVGNRGSRKTVAAVIGRGQRLGLTTVGRAKGIETRAQVEMSQWLGGDVGQRWLLYGPPVSASEIADVLKIPMRVPGTVADGVRSSVPASFLETLPVETKAESRAIYDAAPVDSYISPNAERRAYQPKTPLCAKQSGPFGA